jgi:hypothetical protein
MKNGVLLYLIMLPVLAFAQFPEPLSFQVTVNYIHLGESDWCDNQLVQGPSYCNLFSWEAPDTTNTPATLTGYRIYKDSVFFLATDNTWADTAGGHLAGFYVTATYENPAGESEPSNVVVINNLPIATHAVPDAPEIGIGFDLANQTFIIIGAEHARSLRVYDMRGVLVWSTEVVLEKLRLEGLRAGVYVVVVWDRYGTMHSKVVNFVQR